MKTIRLNIFFFIFALSFFTFSLSFAQEEKPEVKVDGQTEVNKPNSIQAVGDKIEFKNSLTNSILTITDEGSNAASILIPQGPTLTDPNDNDKLYNIGGTLHWNGSALGTNNNAGGWTHSGTNIYNTTLTDKVLIGTNIPSTLSTQAILNIYGSALFREGSAGLEIDPRGTNVALRYYDNTNSGADRIRIRTDGVELIGNVGVGTANPLSKLSVGGDGLSNTSIYGETSGGRGIYGRTTANGFAVSGEATNAGYGGYFSAAGDNGIGIYSAVYQFNAKAIYGYAEKDNSFAGYFAGRGYFSGKVGIGTENPSSKLSVGGSGLSSASISAYTSLATGIGVYSEATASNAYAGYFDGRGYFTGNVGIGQTSPALRLHVKDDQSNNFVAKIENTSIGSNADGLAILINADIPGSGNHFIRFQKSGGAGIGSIDGNGSQVFYNTTSDARLKMNIKEYTNALNVLSSIGIKKYERISNPGTEEIGIIAQELQKVYPQAVSGSPDSDVKTDPMMVDYSKLTPLLVKAVQEQQEKIKKLEKQNAEIKSQNTAVKSKNEELENRLSKIESLLDGKKFTSVSK